MLIPHSDERPGDLYTCLEAPFPSNPVPCNTAMDVSIRSSRVAARRRHAAETPGGSGKIAEQEKRNDLANAIAAAAAAAGTPIPSLSWEFQLLSFCPIWCTWRKDPGILREVVLPNCRARLLQPWCCATPALSGHHATTYGLTKLLLYWHDNRQQLPVLTFLNTP
jgi:hypothetical protein